MVLPVQLTRSEARKISLIWTIATPDKRDRHTAQANVLSARSLYYASPRCPLPVSAAAHPNLRQCFFLSGSVITFNSGGGGGSSSSTVGDDKRRPEISGDDERQCSVQSLTDKRSLFTHVD